MDCPECGKEMFGTEEDSFSGCSWYICKCGIELGIKSADKDVLESYFPNEYVNGVNEKIRR